ncbi:MAG: hypothetical protein ACLSHW_05640 [Lachnospiraceae bacterium]
MEKYQTSEDPILRLSADMLSTFANFTLGNGRGSADGKGRCAAQILKEHLERRRSGQCWRPACSAYYVTSVLIHIPPEEGTPPLDRYLSYLPVGQRLFAISILGVHVGFISNGEYARAQGMVQTATAMTEGIFIRSR